MLTAQSHINLSRIWFIFLFQTVGVVVIKTSLSWGKHTPKDRAALIRAESLFVLFRQIIQRQGASSHNNCCKCVCSEWLCVIMTLWACRVYLFTVVSSTSNQRKYIQQLLYVDNLMKFSVGTHEESLSLRFSVTTKISVLSHPKEITLYYYIVQILRI